MTDQAGPWVAAECRSTAPSKSRAVGVGRLAESRPASGRGRMAGEAVPFDVTAHADLEIAARFPTMVVPADGAAGPDFGCRMESAPTLLRVERSGLSDSEPGVAGDAEGLLAMAARAPLRCHLGGDPMLAEPVVGVNGAGPYTPVVAVGAFLFRVAARAERRVSARDLLVALEPAWPVVGCTQPGGRDEDAGTETCLQDAAPRDMARGALSSGVSPSRARHAVALQAAAHARQLLAGCLGHSSDRAVTLSAADIALLVHRVVEAEVRGRQVDAGDEVARVRLVPEVASGAPGQRLLRVRVDLSEFSVIGAVTAIAACACRQQVVAALTTARRVIVAVDASQSQVPHVLVVRHPDG